jgi:hypothetical protein
MRPTANFFGATGQALLTGAFQQERRLLHGDTRRVQLFFRDLPPREALQALKEVLSRGNYCEQAPDAANDHGRDACRARQKPAEVT